MLDTPPEVVTVIVSGAVIFLVMVSFIVSFLFLHQKRRTQNLREKRRLIRDHERAIQESRLEIQEETLKYVGRELHDNIGQILSLVKLNLYDPQNPQQVAYATELLGGAIADVRRLSKTLNMEWADGVSLSDLIRMELEKVEKSGGYKVEYLSDGTAANLDSQNKLIVFRVFQESLNNIFKHAHATCITVNFQVFNPPGLCILEVADNGVGFDLASAPQGSGLTNIRKRMETIGGQAEIVSRLNSGTRVELKFPYSPPTPVPISPLP